MAPHDPFVLHELGVTAFRSGNLEVAEKYLRDALLKVNSANIYSGVSSRQKTNETKRIALGNLVIPFYYTFPT